MAGLFRGNESDPSFRSSHKSHTGWDETKLIMGRAFTIVFISTMVMGSRLTFPTSGDLAVKDVFSKQKAGHHVYPEREVTEVFPGREFGVESYFEEKSNASQSRRKEGRSIV